MNLLPRVKSRSIKKAPDPAGLAVMLGRWFDSPQGGAVLEAERGLLRGVLERLFGYHVLQLGCCAEHSLIESSPAGHKIVFAPSYQPGSGLPVADIEELPLPTESMDGVLIHHALDFTGDCHRLLREATRVLRPGGRLLILGFNPLSLWGLWRLFRRRSQVPWRGRFIARSRLTDWCRLLDLQVEHSASALHFFASGGRWEGISQQLHSPLGGVYLLNCIKQVAPITPIMPRWLSLRRAPAMPAVEAVQSAPGPTAAAKNPPPVVKSFAALPKQ